MPGQGQTIQVAGVSIGEIGKVTLKDGKAVVQMKIRKKYTPIYRDATALLRPKTGLNDMVDRARPGQRVGRHDPARTARSRSRRRSPRVQLDEFLAGFDADTRDYLQLLVGGAGEGLHGNAEELAATLKRFDPTARYLKRINRAARQARQGDRALDPQLQGAERGARRQGRAAGALRRLLEQGLPGLRERAGQPQGDAAAAAERARADQRRAREVQPAVARSLGPTLTALMPTADGARARARRASSSFAKATTPTFKDQLRPFVPVAAAVGQGAEAGRAATSPSRCPASPTRSTS